MSIITTITAHPVSTPMDIRILLRWPIWTRNHEIARTDFDIGCSLNQVYEIVHL